jgi:hypothetical protein
VAWIIEHVKPLSQALDWLAGDPGQIAGHAQTWRNVASSLRDSAAAVDRAVRWDVSEVGRYRRARVPGLGRAAA